MSKAIRGAIGTGAGKITPEQADAVRLTLLADLAKGLKEMRAQNLMHLDFKAPNCLIGSDGSAKIADFGLSRAGPSTGAEEIMGKNQGVPFMSPEMANFAAQKSRINANATQATNNEHLRVQNAFQGVLGAANDNERAVLLSDVKTAHRQAIEGQRDRDIAAIQLTSASDSFCLGLAAYRMFTGREMDLGGGFASVQQNSLGNYANKAGAVALNFAAGSTT